MKFVIADATTDMAVILYNDILNDNNFYIIDKNKLYKNRLINKICLYNISLRKNFKRKMPLKMFFYKQIFKGLRDLDLCFYFGTSWYDPDLIKLLKKMYPSAKFVLNFHDTVESKLNRFPYMDINQLKTEFNLIYTYDFEDSQEYGFNFIPDMYSRLNEKQIPLYPKYDVVFVGAAKDRLSDIIKAFEAITSAGCTCWFYIVGAKDDEKKHEDKIVYSNNYLPFSEVVGRQINANCILELAQRGSDEPTLRFWDAVMYNKKLISNCKLISNYKYYNPSFVQLITDTSSIDIDFITREIEVDYKYDGDVSPKKVFETIEKDLNKKRENS